jgi:basic membrane protein A
MAGVGLLAGCSGDGDGTDTSSETTDGSDGGTDTSSDGPAANIGVVTGAGGLGDQGFNDLANEGVQRAEEELGISYNLVEPDNVTEFEQFHRQFAQSSSPEYDLVFGVGFTHADTLGTISQDFPDTDFAIIDGVVEQPNVASYTFKEHEGSYLVGVAAGHLSTRDFGVEAGNTDPDSTRLGFVGGVESFLINKFRAGYAAGAQSVDPNIEVLASYVGSFSDPSSAKESAKGMYSNDADIIFPAAGGSGVGVFQAAQEDGRLGFGVDTRKSVTQSEYSDVILGSMIKQTDNAVFQAIESLVNDEYAGGSVIELGLEDGGVDLVTGEEIGDQIPDDVMTAVDDSRQGIIDGNIDVPTEI